VRRLPCTRCCAALTPAAVEPLLLCGFFHKTITSHLPGFMNTTYLNVFSSDNNFGL
jgi:hypothetical protein